tara:strand:+ start:580 stop:1332 length:753 start_codon:yes stop_codon:yes gene_type:complete
MSRFISKLSKVGENSTSNVGFGALSRSSQSAGILFLGKLPIKDASIEQSLNSFDALVIETEKFTSKSIAQCAKNFQDHLWGVSAMGKITKEDAVLAHESGADFIIFDPMKAPASIFDVSELGLILTVPLTVSELDTKSMRYLPVDAISVCFDTSMQTMTAASLGRILGIVNGFGKPTLISGPGLLEIEAVQALRNAQINAVVLDASHTTEATKLKAQLTGLPRLHVRSQSDTGLVPSIGQTAIEKDESED